MSMHKEDYRREASNAVSKVSEWLATHPTERLLLVGVALGVLFSVILVVLFY